MQRKSQIRQAVEPLELLELDVFNKTISPYITNSTTTMQGFLKRTEMIKMNNYHTVKQIENIYNYTTELK